MIAFYNALGGLMWVTEDRVEEYKALGYMPVPTIEPTEAPAEKPEPVKPAVKKTATKKTVSKKK